MVKPVKSKAEQPYEWFDLLYPRRKRDLQKLKEILLGSGALNPAPFSVIDYLLSPAPGKSKSICQSVVVENRYMDKDHSRALSAFYSKAFRPTPKECVRMHFFSKIIQPSEILDIDKQENSYLGFCVLRPFPFRRIGKTVLKSLSARPALEFPTCRGNFEVSIGGAKLGLRGPCFMEQDTMVAACGSVALWMSTTTTARRFGLRQYTTTEITAKANEYLCQSRAMPSEGLVPEQMIHCLRSIGYDPILVDASDQEAAKFAMYTSVESEIPPILLCRLATGGHHSVVAVGHGYRLPIEKPALMELEWTGEQSLYFSRSSEWIPSLLVNDDQRGIYRKMTFLEPDIDSLTARIKAAHPTVDIAKLDLNEWHCPVAIDMNMSSAGYDGGEDIADVWAVIIPLPEQVPLTCEQAEGKAAQLIRYWHWQNNIPLPDDLVLRTYLISSNEYKLRILESQLDNFVKILYRGKPMPRWIWVTEISSKNSYNSASPADWKIRGEVIIDATSSPWVPDFVAFHFISGQDAVLASMKPDDNDIQKALAHVLVSKKDKPYLGWIR